MNGRLQRWREKGRLRLATGVFLGPCDREETGRNKLGTCGTGLLIMLVGRTGAVAQWPM